MLGTVEAVFDHALAASCFSATVAHLPSMFAVKWVRQCPLQSPSGHILQLWAARAVRVSWSVNACFDGRLPLVAADNLEALLTESSHASITTVA